MLAVFKGTVPILAAMLLCGCGRVAERKAADRVNAVLPRFLGSAETYRTTVDAASTGAVLRGRLRSVHIVGEGVRLEPDLIVNRLTLDADAVTVDPRAGTLEAVGSAAFRCEIRAENLNRYVTRTHPGIRDLAVALDGAAIRVQARPEALGWASVPMRVTGTLKPLPSGSQISFLPSRAAVWVAPIPRVVLDLLAKRLNPLIDLSGMPLAVHLDRIGIADGVLTLSGTIPPAEILKAANSEEAKN